LVDLREGVSITDLGLNDFRIDLSNYIKTFGELKNIPEGLHAVTAVKPNTERGVIFILKNINSQINIDKLNRLHPYYLVFIKESGEIVYNHADAKKTLDCIRLVCKGINEPLVDLCQNFSEETNEYREMDLYSGLLQKSISSILKTEEEKDILSLFKSGGTTALQSKIKGIEDFKLISFVVIK